MIAGAGLFWTARLVHIGYLDALALAEKAAVPDPVSALDWPELQVRAALLVAIDGDVTRSADQLERWRAESASIAPARRAAPRLELRRRRSLERVGGILIAKDVGGTGQRCWS